MKKLFLMVLGLSAMSQIEALKSGASKRHKNFQQLVESMNEVANSMFDDCWADFENLDRSFLSDADNQESPISTHKNNSKKIYATTFAANNLHGSKVSEKGVFQVQFPQTNSSVKPEGEVVKQELTNQTLLDQAGAKVYKLYELCESAENYKKTVTITAKKTGLKNNQMIIETTTNFEHQQAQGICFGNSSQSSCKSLFVPDEFEPEIASVKIVEGGIEVELAKKVKILEQETSAIEEKNLDKRSFTQVCPHCHKNLAASSDATVADEQIKS